MRTSIRRRAPLVALATAAIVPLLSASAIAELPVRPTESHIDDSLAGVAVTSPEYDRLAAEYEAALSGREAAQQRAEELALEEAVQVETVRKAEAAVTRARRAMVDARESLASMAVSAYVGIEGAEPAEVGAAIANDAVHLDDSRVVVAELVGEDRVDTVTVARGRARRARVAFDEAEQKLASIRAARIEIEAERDRLLEIELTVAPDVTDARAVARVEGRDLTLVALDAYTAAARTTAETDPSCGIEWELLAGIGRVESRHGTFGGTRLTAEGETEERIIGIPLNGGNNTAVITDTDGGELDGDTTHDRAVGPMQFIPSTWARWALDGDGDDEADPHNIYDTALTAAAYLCASGPGLDTDAGRSRAVFSYNHSQAYVAQVSSYADGYRSLAI